MNLIIIYTQSMEVQVAKSGGTTGKKVPLLPTHQELSPEKKISRPKAPDPEAWKRIIRGLNLKVTDQRLLILEVLQCGDQFHVTAQEVFEQVSKKDRGVGFATVYRFLRRLKEAGFVTEVKVGGLPARYELTPAEHHDHLTCVRCGKICEFENEQIENLQQKIAKEMGFILTHHVLELYGVCVDCQRKEAQLARFKKG